MSNSGKETTRVLRVYHGGRDPGHRHRERALLAAGVNLNLVIPHSWPEPGSEKGIGAESFAIHELPVVRAGDINRHRYQTVQSLIDLVHDLDPEVIDVQEEPYSLAARQWLSIAGHRPVVMYTAQNLDKRYPPPFGQYERRALSRVQGLYPCSRQAASVLEVRDF